MASSYKKLYGLDFPAAQPSALCALQCWKHWREDKYKAGPGYDPVQCFWDGIYSIVPPETFTRHKWAEQHVADWTLENFVITWGCASSGKAQPLDAVVYTPGGPRTMGELQPGDMVFSVNGRPSKIIRTHDVGVQEEYVVQFAGGVDVHCAGTHLWEVGLSREPQKSRRVVEARTLEGLPARKMFVPLCAPLEFEPRPVPVDPYVLGCLLGDGTFGGRGGLAALVFTSVDDDIVAGVNSRLGEAYELSGSKPTYRIVKKSRKRTGRGPRNSYIQALRDYGLWAKLSNEKFVPDDYLFNSVSVRRDVLAGLLDTDGTAKKDATVAFCSTSERLARAVLFLVQSLGGWGTLSLAPNYYRDKNGARVRGQDAYNVQIIMADARALFKCARKVGNARNGRLGSSNRKILRVARTGRAVPMKCITIEDPRGLYIASGCVPTHNSNDYGLLTVVDWMVDPAKTVSIMASTSLQMLKLRSYESVLRYFQTIQSYAPWKMPGKLRKTDSAIILDDDDALGVATDKASIRGVAVAEGTDTEARAKLQGAHLPYVRLLLDELSQMRPAAMKVRTNLAIGADDFKLVGLCNPDTFTDLASQFSCPTLPGGFAALDPAVDFEWRSQFGKIRRHDGLQSPAILEPDGSKRLPFLLTKGRLDQLLAEHSGNEDDPEVWTMIRGFPPSQGKRQTLISMAEVMRSSATEDVIWRLGPSVTVLGCDPAFSDGGNKAVMQAISAGFDKDGMLKLSCHEPHYVKVAASSPVPVTEQVGLALKDYADLLGVQPSLVGVDDSATQSVADFVKSKYGMVVNRFSSGAKPSDMLMARGDIRKASERYYNQITELWAAVAAFIQAGQMRNFPLIAAEQLSARPMEPNKRPHRLLSKKTSLRDGGEMKSGDSPDEADAMAYAVGILRFVLNLIAGSDTLSDKYAGPWGQPSKILGSGLRQLARKHDLDARAYQS